MNATGNVEYRIAHLHERLAKGELGELGIRIEAHGTSVTIVGAVPTSQSRDQLLRTVKAELPELRLHFDIVVADSSAPSVAEELT